MMLFGLRFEEFSACVVPFDSAHDKLDHLLLCPLLSNGCSAPFSF